MFHVPEKNRITNHPYYGSDSSFGNNGVFKIHPPFSVKEYLCIVSDMLGWEHVSVSMTKTNNASKKKTNAIPTWDDMCFIKSLFWDEDDTVLQFHPKKSEYVNNHDKVLHLWRKVGVDHELPPNMMI